jgi:Fe2+ transport system protein FeoA
MEGNMAGGKRLMTLDELQVGKRAVIKSVGGEGALRRRLLDLGLTPYTPVMVRKVAPLGDPIEIYLRGYELTLRRSEAKAIEVMFFECSGCGNCYFGMKHRCPGTDKACQVEAHHRNRHGEGGKGCRRDSQRGCGTNPTISSATDSERACRENREDMDGKE